MSSLTAECFTTRGCFPCVLCFSGCALHSKSWLGEELPLKLVQAQLPGLVRSDISAWGWGSGPGARNRKPNIRPQCTAIFVAFELHHIKGPLVFGNAQFLFSKQRILIRDCMGARLSWLLHGSGSLVKATVTF